MAAATAGDEIGDHPVPLLLDQLAGRVDRLAQRLGDVDVEPGELAVPAGGAEGRVLAFDGDPQRLLVRTRRAAAGRSGKQGCG